MEIWLPTIVAGMFLGFLLWILRGWKTRVDNRLDKVEEKFMSKEEHETFCDLAHAEFKLGIQQTVAESEKNILKTIEKLRDDLKKNGNV